jgi:hypothetical protein
MTMMNEREAQRIVYEEAQRIIDGLWLTGCHPKPVDQVALLSALLDQGRGPDGHHVSDKVLDLRMLAGVMPHSGYALVMRAGSWGSANEPPGGTIRSSSKFDALFYPEDGPCIQHAETIESLPDVTAPIRNACARWGTDSKYEKNKLLFPWGSSSTKDLDPGVLRRTGQEGALGAVAHHAYLFRIGHVPGVCALAAGRLGDAVLAIIKTRWMFDTQGEPRR